MAEEPDKIPYLPERLTGLGKLSLNLWWRWNRRARLLLRSVDPVLWSATRHNPVEMLRKVDPGRLAHCVQDPEFLEAYDRVISEFGRALEPDSSWFLENFGDLADRTIAYFCAEFGLHNSIPIYSGGLGVLAGDHCKGASDVGVPLVGVGLLYSKGYFDQKLNMDGWQEGSDERFDQRIMPLLRVTASDHSHALTVLETAGRPVHVGAWRLDAGRVRLFLLDTNLPENHPEGPRAHVPAVRRRQRASPQTGMDSGRRGCARLESDRSRSDRLARQRGSRGVHDGRARAGARRGWPGARRGNERGATAHGLHDPYTRPGGSRHFLTRAHRFRMRGLPRADGHRCGRLPRVGPAPGARSPPLPHDRGGDPTGYPRERGIETARPRHEGALDLALAGSRGEPRPHQLGDERRPSA